MKKHLFSIILIAFALMAPCSVFSAWDDPPSDYCVNDLITLVDQGSRYLLDHSQYTILNVGGNEFDFHYHGEYWSGSAWGPCTGYGSAGCYPCEASGSNWYYKIEKPWPPNWPPYDFIYVNKATLSNYGVGYYRWVWHCGSDSYGSDDPYILLYYDGVDLVKVEDLPPIEANLTIDYPESGTSTASTFEMGLTYNLAGNDFQKIRIVFESWNASTTCPIYGTETWEEEYNNGWFNYQSGPYYSPLLTATSTQATTTVGVSSLNENVYNCVRCCFFNQDLITISAEQCEDYILIVGEYTPISQPLPIILWENYYTANTDEKFTSSTAIFNTIAGVFENLYIRLTDFLTVFSTLFDNNKAEEKGTELGEKIPSARGYVKPINDFLGGFPISEFFIFAITVSLIAIFYRIIKAIIMLVRG